MSESHEQRLRRLSMRAHRRGTKEMDLILGRFARARLAALDATALDLFEVLLDENDHDLYRWVTGRETPPGALAGLIGQIASEAGAQ